MIDVANSYHNIAREYPNAIWRTGDSEAQGLSVVTPNFALVSLTKGQSLERRGGPAWVSSHPLLKDEPSLRSYLYQTSETTREFSRHSDDIEHGDLSAELVEGGRVMEAALLGSRLLSVLVGGTVLSGSVHTEIVKPWREMTLDERLDRVGKFAQDDRYALGTVDEALLRLGPAGQQV